MVQKIRIAYETELMALLDLLYQLSPKSEEDSKASKRALERTLKAMIKNEDYRLAVCDVDGKIAGTATLLVQQNLSHGGRPYGHIENVVTDAASRGKGIGAELVRYLLAEAKKRNCYKVILDCKEDNVSFYEKLGMHKTSEVELRIDL